MSDELFALLSQEENSDAMKKFIEKHQFTLIQKSDATRHYLGSKNKDLDLLFKNGKLSSLQFFVDSYPDHNPFKGRLPFGIKRGMRQDEIHKLLGEPTSFDEYHSRFTFDGKPGKLTIYYAELGTVQRFNITA